MLGKLLSQIDPDAWIVLVGDNGTPEVSPAASRAKFSVFERGIKVPFLLVGPGLEARESQRLVHVVDIWPSLADALRLPCQAPDGVSVFGEARTWLYCVQRANNWTPKREETIVEERWKLRVVDDTQEVFFDLQADPGEDSPLAADQVPVEVVEKLRGERREARGSL